MKRRWFGLVIVALMLAWAVWSYPRLPAEVPTHWNWRGEITDTRGKSFTFLLPAMAFAMWLLLPLLRRIDPRRDNYERFDDTFWLLVNGMVMFVAVVHVLLVGVGLGWPVQGDQVIMLAVGAMLLLLGNYLPRVRSNWWVGIRTPWTLENEDVWRATHRVAGWTFVAGGALTMIAALLPAELRLSIAFPAMMAAALIPVAYSYYSWRRFQRGGRERT